MKFSHSIQFNSVPEWNSHYIAYSNLKKLMFTLEKEVNAKNVGQPTDTESSPLLSAERDDPDKVFSHALLKELERIEDFFKKKQNEVFEELEDVLGYEEQFQDEHEALIEDPEAGPQINRRRSNSHASGSKMKFVSKDNSSSKRRQSFSRPTLERVDSDDSDDEEVPDRQGLKRASTTTDSEPSSPTTRRRPSSKRDRRYSTLLDEVSESGLLSAAQESGVTLKKRMISMYVLLSEIKSYVQLNRTGFSKILKKYDKTLDRSLKQPWLDEHITGSYTFSESTMDSINERIGRVEQSYASLNTQGNVELARRELRLDLREHVVWERNTVWREMIGIERKAQAANLGVRRTLFGGETSATDKHAQGVEGDGATKEVETPVGRYRIPHFLQHSSFYVLIGALTVFILLLTLPIMELPEQQNCLALVVFVSLLWATEAIPLFVTSLLVPFLVVVLRVVRQDQRPYERLQAKAAASYIFSAMWTPVIMLLLGGFTIAAALSKYNVAKMIATFVLSKAGTKPRNVLLTNMFVSMFASMWISNVAAPVLCFSIIQPILRNLPHDSDMIKALLLGIALSANIGGAASPIASPQNLIALQNMAPEPGWAKWFFISLPVCIISILLIWVLLLVTLKPGRNTNIVAIRPMKDKFTGTQWFISAVTLLTIALWCVSHQLESTFGDMGVVAIVPLVLFFGTGILTKEDFNNFLWTIIILAAGGLALGKAVNSSGLLHTMAEWITSRVQDLSLFSIMAVFAAIILVVASFISHTVAALIFLPLVKTVGEGMSEPHPNLLVMSSVLMCSAAMALPTSGFPNMTAIMMEDSQTGQRYLQVRHFLTRGIPASIITFGVVVSLGYVLMRIAGL